MTEKPDLPPSQKPDISRFIGMAGDALGITRVVLEARERQRQTKDAKSAIETKSATVRQAIEDSIAKPQPSEVQDELSRLTILLPGLLSGVDPRRTVTALDDIDLVLKAIAANNPTGQPAPNLEFVRNVRKELEDQENREAPGFYGSIYRKAGRSPIRAVLTGVGVSFSTILLVTAGLLFAAEELRSGEILSENLTNKNLWLYVFLQGAAFLGSLISIAIRLEEFSKIPRHDPLLVFLTGFYKPIIGIGFAIFLYSVLQTGFIKIAGWDGNHLDSLYFAVALGFLCGFSERIGKDVIARLENKIAPSAAKPPPPSTG